MKKIAQKAERGTRNDEPNDPETETRLSAQRRSPIDESLPPPLDTRDLLIDPLDQFLKDLHDKTDHDRTILNHLLHQTFLDAEQPAAVAGRRVATALRRP